MTVAQTIELTRSRVAFGLGGLLLSFLWIAPTAAQTAAQTAQTEEAQTTAQPAAQTTTQTAQSSPAPTATPVTTTSAASRNTPEWWVWVRRAERFVREVQYAAAGGALERALMLAPDEPVAHHHLGEVHRLRGDLRLALREFRTAGRLAAAQENRGFEARALYNIAETLERMVGRLPEARAAWEALRIFGEQHPDVVAPQIARARVAAIDRASDQELVYREVRTMIRREMRAPASSDASVRSTDEDEATTEAPTPLAQGAE